MTLFTRDTALSAIWDLSAWAAEWAEKAEGTPEEERARAFSLHLSTAREFAPEDTNMALNRIAREVNKEVLGYDGPYETYPDGGQRMSGDRTEEEPHG